jgi:hypothetical protein
MPRERGAHPHGEIAHAGRTAAADDVKRRRVSGDDGVKNRNSLSASRSVLPLMLSDNSDADAVEDRAAGTPKASTITHLSA